MAKKAKKKRVEFSNIVWVMDNLTTKQLAEHDKKPYSGIEEIAKLTELIELDFKLSLKWDDYNGCLLATAICDSAESTNAGLAVSSRGQDVEDVLSILLYKIFNIASGDLRVFADEKPKGVRG